MNFHVSFAFSGRICKNAQIVPRNTYFLVGSTNNPYINCTYDNPAGIFSTWIEYATVEVGRLIASIDSSLFEDEFRIEGTSDLVLLVPSSTYAGKYLCRNNDVNPLSNSAELIVLGKNTSYSCFSIIKL